MGVRNVAVWCERRFPCGYDAAAGYLSASVSNQPEGLEPFLQRT